MGGRFRRLCGMANLAHWWDPRRGSAPPVACHAILRGFARPRCEIPGCVLKSQRGRWWWYLGIPAGIAAGVVLAVLLRTSRDDALTLHRGEQIDAGFTSRLDPGASSTPDAADGRFLVVVFGYTSCPDVCPATLLVVQHVLERLGTGAGRVVPIFVTVDPARDTAERLRTYLASFDARIRGISDPAVVASTLRTFRARAEKRVISSGGDYSMDHTAILYVIDPSRRVIAALPESSPTLSADLVRALAGLGD